MVGWLGQFITFIQHIISQGNAETLTAVFLVAMLTEFCIPFPMVLDTFLFMLGFQITSLWPMAIVVVLVAMVGRLIGASGVFWLSRSLGRAFINWIWRFTAVDFCTDFLIIKVSDLNRKGGISRSTRIKIG